MEGTILTSYIHEDGVPRRSRARSVRMRSRFADRSREGQGPGGLPCDRWGGGIPAVLGGPNPVHPNGPPSASQKKKGTEDRSEGDESQPPRRSKLSRHAGVRKASSSRAGGSEVEEEGSLSTKRRIRVADSVAIRRCETGRFAETGYVAWREEELSRSLREREHPSLHREEGRHSLFHLQEER